MSFNTLSYGPAEAEEIISRVTIPGEFLHTPSEEIRSRDLERELRRKTALELHYVTLAEYHKVKRIPRGLRVSLRPTLFQDRPDFCQKFESILNKCSMDIIILTIEHLHKELSTVEAQVTSIQQQLSSTLTPDKFDLILQKTNKTIEEFRSQLQERKRSKFLRDAEDYHREQVTKAGEKYKRPTRRGRRQHSAREFTDTHTISGRDNQIVYNISSYNLSPTEYNVLQKGLSFCPTPSFNGFILDQELHRFFRSLRLKVHFNSNPTEERTADVNNSSQSVTSFQLKQLGLRVSSNYNRPRTYHPVETYISLVKRDVEADLKSIQKGSIRIHRNLSVIEKDALRNLKENKRIVIKPADKGGSIVVMDKSHYTSIIQSQLNDRTTYQSIDRDPTFDVAREIRLIIKTYKEKGTIDAKLSEYLINTQPMIPVFYVLPKVHKDLMNPPGRPIVASTNSLLSPLAITLDRILTPLLHNISSYLKDTTDFLSKLHAITPVVSGCTLVTLDVNSLYTCIDHQRGIAAVQWFLTEHTDFSPDQLQFCVDLLSFVLHKNFFMFGDQYYIQRTGTAMGSNMAPPYANIFMAAFEETYVYTHPLFQTHSVYWKRYIDDVFMIWRGGEDLLLRFVSDINTCVPNLSFSMQKSNVSINFFLDTMITLEADGNLDVDLYCKPTDKNSLLHYSSCHPRHVKQSLPISQYHRLSRIVSNEEKQAIRHHEMSVKFLQRGYPLRTLQKATNNIRNNRVNLGRQRIPFVSTFHPYLYKIKNCVLRHWDLLGKAYPGIPEFNDTPIMCYKKPSNLRNLLVKADIGSDKPHYTQRTLSTQKRGTFPCLHCFQCSNITKGETFSHPRSGKIFNINGFFTCNSSYVIYLIKCPCGLGYVGETSQHIRDRISQHRSTIRCQKLMLPIPAHFAAAGHNVSQLKYQVIESVALPRRGGSLMYRFIWNHASFIVLPSRPILCEHLVL
ncbi:unnamed protein product [Ranitomeya imitator]|uniref:Reverse transcriptase domain-containing protein n=1 Tax=Ranitomeya imitator TaxID=111125 RepID=A0ABN9LMU7_9NEOB|nr:unnamed protein product [Ranitomeya imitator]